MLTIASESRLTNIGDYRINYTQTGDDIKPTAKVVTSITHSRGCSPGMQGQSDPGLSQSISYSIETPVVKTLNQEDLVQELAANPTLMAHLIMGGLEGLVSSGFTGDLTNVDPNVLENLAREAKTDVEILLEARKGASDKAFQVSRALVAQATLSTNIRDGVEIYQRAQKVEENDWIPSFVPARIAQSIVSEEERQKTFRTGLEWITNDTRSIVIGGWALLAGSAETAEEKQVAYELVMKDSKTRFFDMRLNVQIAAAMLADNSQREERFSEAFEEHRDARYYAFEVGALLAMAITAPEGEKMSKVYRISNKRLKEGYSHRYTMTDMMVLALTAQTDPERFKAYKLAQLYANPDGGWKNLIEGCACAALGVLGAKDRDLALKNVASYIGQIE